MFWVRLKAVCTLKFETKLVKLVAKIIIKKLFNVNAKNIKVKIFLKL